MFLQRYSRLLLLLTAALVLPLCTSCKEEEGQDDEYADWQARNERFFATLEDSLLQDKTHWQRYKTFTATENSADELTKYIYVKVLRSDDEVRQANDALGWETNNESPLYTDSVRVAYRGRLIPTASYPKGLSFDYTYVGDYSRTTTATKRFLVSGLAEGFATAVMNMKRGDRWRVYIPHQLGYGSTEQTTIPAYSTLIFDIDLFDFCHADNQLRPWQ